jgi:hypothetical protein
VLCGKCGSVVQAAESRCTSCGTVLEAGASNCIVPEIGGTGTETLKQRIHRIRREVRRKIHGHDRNIN